MPNESPSERERTEPRFGRRPEQEPAATLGELVAMDPGAFLSLAGIPSTGPVKVINAGVFPYIVPIDTVEREWRDSAEGPWLAIVEFVAVRDPDAVPRLETTTLHCSDRLALPVVPILALLRPEADGPDITGQKVTTAPWGDPISRFSYEVRRVWQEPAADPPGRMWPRTLERLGASGDRDLVRELAQQMAATAITEKLEPVACLVFSLPNATRKDKKLLGEIAELERMAPCVYLLSGKHDRGRIVTREEGNAAMRWKLFQQGTPRFGPPDERLAAIIGGITSPRRLTELDGCIARIESRDFPITTWDQLLEWREPNPRPD